MPLGMMLRLHGAIDRLSHYQLEEFNGDGA